MPVKMILGTRTIGVLGETQDFVTFPDEPEYPFYHWEGVALGAPGHPKSGAGVWTAANGKVLAARYVAQAEAMQRDRGITITLSRDAIHLLQKLLSDPLWEKLALDGGGAAAEEIAGVLLPHFLGG